MAAPGRGVLFDFNGTLIFDTPIQHEAWSEMAVELRGRGFEADEFKMLNGRTNVQLLEHIIGRKPSPSELEAVAEKKESIYRNALLKANVPLTPGATELFDSLKAAGIPFTIATSSGLRNVKFFLETYRLDRWFEFERIVYNDGTFRGKPNPDIFRIAAGRIGADIAQCVVFEDSTSGITAAHAAGAPTIYGLLSGTPREELLAVPGCTTVIPDYVGLTAESIFARPSQN